MTEHKTLASVGTCQECGKQCFVSRKAARRYMKHWNPPRGRYQYMSVYKCGDYWHYGHTPYEVARSLRAR